ncbi:zinc-binding protein A33-like [Osmerus eperlanus]|uniref:zinc-binding protein A33-like n=1 Tax=Osmerus eperlanus TaxID=29151 RepID=UPI002E10D409
MADYLEPSLSEEDLLCPVCCEVFNVPVELRCGHFSCKACLEKLWARKGSRECPVCRTVSLVGKPPINLALKIASESFQEQRTYKNTVELCLLHKEELQLFCHNDEELVCLFCKSSTQHKVHECFPVGEYALDKKKDVSAKLDSFHKHLKILKMTKEDWGHTKLYIKTQADQTEKQINEEFAKLHQFLWTEEKAKLVKLRKEEELKTTLICGKLEFIEKQIADLSGIIADLEKTWRKNDLLFLKDYKQTKTRSKYTLRNPECLRDILIDVAGHVGSLKFQTWRKMKDIVQCYPITLDPNTAQANLTFSEEFTSVEYCSRQVLPDNPERHTHRIAVLAAKGFTSGKHSWTVEVGPSSDWYIGVARESIKRKSTVFMSPSEGFWVIGLCNGDKYWAQTSARTRLSVKNRPQRIIVELDYDKGRVVFLNAADLTSIHTFKDKFTERMFPYLSPGMSECGKSCISMRICPLTISRVQWAKTH